MISMILESGNRTILERMQLCRELEIKFQKELIRIDYRLLNWREGSPPWLRLQKRKTFAGRRLYRTQQRLRQIMDERNRLIEQFLPLVHHVVNKFKSRNESLCYDDLVGVGNVGLILAAERYKPYQGTSFKTYAYRSIQSHVAKDCHRQRTILSVPEAKRAGLEFERMLSLDYEREDGPTLQLELPQRLVEYESDEIAELNRQLASLPKRWADAVRFRFLDPDVGGQNYQTVAEQLGVSKERARQLVRSGLNLLKKQWPYAVISDEQI